jgi:sialic acid synthase SpsE/quercetin dioxygenase-like cupin family protein
VTRKETTARPLFIFEMANNHMGDVEHGLRIVKAMGEVAKDFSFSFGIKLQYRDIPAFIHPDYRARMDLKFVKRFSETQLAWDDYRRIKDAMHEHGMLAICTPWDERSVERIEEHGYDFLKIPSCYWTDWPLLERIAASSLPVIGSVAGVGLEDIDRVVSFFRHRERPFSVMHCVGEYPTRDENLQLNQIKLLKERYPGLEVGYSTHERPDNYEAVKVAIGLGATMFEKHVGVPTDAAPLNAYSANPEQVRRWLESAADAYAMLGVEGRRCSFTAEEIRTLRALQRGVFAKAPVKAGELLRPENLYLAMPNQEGQLVANDLSKYSNYTALEAVEPNQPVMKRSVYATETRAHVYRAISEVRKLLKKSKVIVPGQLELEISHHYGMEKFEQFGSTIITVVNREYCKRVIVLLAGQTHPQQYHKQKDETYHVLHGEILLTLDGQVSTKKANDVVVIPRGMRHGFTTRTGTVIEEVSSSYSQCDSFYDDPAIEGNANRKTFVTYWMDLHDTDCKRAATAAAGK